LIARVRSLARLKTAFDELRSRAATTASLGMPDPLAHAFSEDGMGGHILLIEDRASSANQTMVALRGLHNVEIETDPQEALFKSVTGAYDLFVVSLGIEGFDALRLCSQIRSLERTRHLPILCVADLEDRTRILRGLDLGVNDFLVRPIDRNELVARVRTQLRRKRYADKLRDNVQASIELAVVDPLTGLNNRRYFETHFATLVEHASNRGRPLSVMILDIDHFKSVNDTHGHDSGDKVLKCFAERIRRVIRHADLLCRLGGEEFVVIMPDTPLDIAQKIAERVRAAVEKDRFPTVEEGHTIVVTVSIGLAERGGDCGPEGIFRRADRALYRSKSSGRNRVSADAA
jgi:two-component system, cell cycle response regulator